MVEIIDIEDNYLSFATGRDIVLKDDDRISTAANMAAMCYEATTYRGQQNVYGQKLPPKSSNATFSDSDYRTTFTSSTYIRKSLGKNFKKLIEENSKNANLGLINDKNENYESMNGTDLMNEYALKQQNRKKLSKTSTTTQWNSNGAIINDYYLINEVQNNKVNRYEKVSRATKYNTYIGPFDIKNSKTGKQLNINIDGNKRNDDNGYTCTAKYNDTTYKFDIILKNNKIYIGHKTLKVLSYDALEDLKITETYSIYKARIIFFAGTSMQTRAIGRGVKKNQQTDINLIYDNSDNLDCSIEQYVSEVRDPQGNITNLGSHRKTKNYTVNSNSQINKSIKATDEFIKNSQVDGVSILKGSTVTYTIHVYNNTGSKIEKDVVVKNRVDREATNIKCYDSAGNEVQLEKFNEGSGVGNYYKFRIRSGLNALGRKFYLKVTYKDITREEGKYVVKTYINHAWNKTKYRTEDWDNVYLYKKNLSLQLYIQQAGTTNTEGDRKDRLGNRDWLCRNIITYGIASKDAATKLNDPVKISGDVNTLKETEVTVKLYLYNNADVKVKNATSLLLLPKGASIVGKNASGTYKFEGLTSAEKSSWTKYFNDSDYEFYKVTFNEINPYNKGMKLGDNSQWISIKMKGLSKETNNKMIAQIFNTSDRSDIYRVKDYDNIVTSKNDVSLQTFISGVRNSSGNLVTFEMQNGSSAGENNTGRAWKSVYTDDAKNATVEGHKKQISNIPGYTNVANGTGKSERKVKIDNGYTLDHDIYVYNNGDNTAKNTVVYFDVRNEGSIVSVKQGTNLSYQTTNGAGSGWQRYYVTVNEISAKSNKKITVKVKYTGIKEDTFYNFMAKIDPEKTGTSYRTKDFDYFVKEAIPTDDHISIQKRVVSVNGTNVSSRENWSTNGGEQDVIRRTSDKSAQFSINGTNKYQNPVEVNVGDEVMYEIALYHDPIESFEKEEKSHDCTETNDYLFSDDVTKNVSYKYNNYKPIYKEQETIGKFVENLPEAATKYKIIDQNGTTINNWANVTDKSISIDYKFPGFTEGGGYAGQNQKYYLTVKFDKYSEEIQENTAKVNVNQYNYTELKEETKSHDKITHWYDIFHPEQCYYSYLTASDSGKKYRITDSDYVKIVNPSVSVQKYVTSINGETLNESRENLYALKEGNTDGFMETPYKHEDRDIAEGVSVTNTENIKKDNPVKAIITSENTFEATYRVVLYNNSDKNVLARVRDYVQKGEITRVIDSDRVTHSIDKHEHDLGNYSGSDLDTLERQGNNIWHLYTDDGIRNGSFSNEDNWYTAVIELGAKSTKTLDITVEHKSLEEDECIYNRVWVPATIQVSGYERVASSNNTSNKYRNIDADFVQAVRIPDVSLQKFVSKVGDEDTSNRENRMAVSSENGLLSGYNHSREINPSITAYSESEEDTKLKQKQEVIGKKNVKYSIIVYNNGGTDTTVNLKDNIGINSDNGRIVSVKKDYMDIEINYSAAGKDIWQVANNGECTYSFDLEAGSSALIELEVEFFAKITEDITNTAWISSITVGNKTIETKNNNKDFNYRTVDADYVYVKATPDLSLEKYVVSVGDKNNNEQERISYEDRVSQPIYGQKDEASDSYTENTWKSDNKVYAEKGDTVTYNIVIKNVGESTAKISQINDTMDSEIFDENIIVNGGAGEYQNGIITFSDTMLKKDDILTISVQTKIKNFSDGEIENTASLTDIRDENGNPTEDLDPRNNEDTDYMQEKIYSASIEKYVSAVNGNPIDGRSEKPIYLSGEENNDKFNNPVTVNENDEVTYTIKVKNEGSFKTNRYEDKYGKIKVSQILDALNSDTYGERLTDTEKEEIKSKLKDNLIATGESSEFTFTYTVNVPNITLNVLTNTATINEIKNRNDVIVDDESADDNTDKDYIQLDNITIDGMVWNDKKRSKADEVNGKYDTDEDKFNGNEPISETVEVYLYRDGNNEVIANTTTDSAGNYSFGKDIVEKGPKAEGTSRWNGTYYSYYVAFEYNGVIYTPTIFKEITENKDGEYYSNAKEDNDNGIKGITKRDDFNNKFNNINNKSGLNYSKLNEESYIPQSNVKYKDKDGQIIDKMKMQCSTNIIKLEDKEELEFKLKRVCLGLKNRNVFDLELTNNIDKVTVTVNGESYEYKGTQKVEIRAQDTGNYNLVNQNNIYYNNNKEDEDKDKNAQYVYDNQDKFNQKFRNTDIDCNKSTDGKYTKTGLGVKVTYKLKIKNMSDTAGTPTQIIDYYDEKYTFSRAYYKDDDGIEKNYDKNNLDKGSNYVIIKQEKELTNNGNEMYIYIEFTLNSPEGVLSSIYGNNDTIATYNMAEIYEYNTKKYDGDFKYMQGLIDRDSEPGSVENEKANLKDGIIDENKTTLGYYFDKNDLSKLKYEDDTDTAPVLYFVSENSPRTITGIVFKDKNGDGIYKKADGDKIIEGANVTLVETVNKGAGAEAKDGEYYVVYTATTDSNGIFTIKGFLPGVHHMEYQYGNNDATLIIDGGTDSYNGYLYESTKNYYENVEGEYWYKDKSDRKSTATERARDRDKVSDYTKTLNNAVTKVLNCYMIERINQSTNVNYGLYTTLMEQTKMTADTPDMRFDVEKEKDAKEFKDYDVENIDFGIRNRNETHITLDKKISSARITDSTGKNVLVNVEYDDSGKPIKITGDAIIPGGQQGNGVDISMIDKNLQGAKLDITYVIRVIRNDQKGTANGNGLENKEQTITLIDYVPNSLNVNGTDWAQVAKDRDITAYDINLKNTINKVKRDVGVTNGGNNEVDIKMETVLTAVDSTIESIITSADSLLHEYKNIVEVEQVTSGSGNPEILITKQITNDEESGADKISDTDIKPLLEGTKGESIIAASDLLSIHPPTGSEGLSITHYIIGATALIILSVGIVLIKKFALKKE